MFTYEYHDALLDRAEITHSNCLSLTFSLYPVFYAEPSRVQVTFHGVINLERVTKFIGLANQSLDADSDEPIATCRTLRQDSKRPSQMGDVFAFLELDSPGHIRIHCQTISEVRLPDGYNEA
jgi:hypothetical protein